VVIFDHSLIATTNQNLLKA